MLRLRFSRRRKMSLHRSTSYGKLANQRFPGVRVGRPDVKRIRFWKVAAELPDWAARLIAMLHTALSTELLTQQVLYLA
jgi:hypothetical protein